MKNFWRILTGFFGVVIIGAVVSCAFADYANGSIDPELPPLSLFALFVLGFGLYLKGFLDYCGGWWYICGLVYFTTAIIGIDKLLPTGYSLNGVHLGAWFLFLSLLLSTLPSHVLFIFGERRHRRLTLGLYSAKNNIAIPKEIATATSLMVSAYIIGILLNIYESSIGTMPWKNTTNVIVYFIYIVMVAKLLKNHSRRARFSYVLYFIITSLLALSVLDSPVIFSRLRWGIVALSGILDIVVLVLLFKKQSSDWLDDSQ